MSDHCVYTDNDNVAKTIVFAFDFMFDKMFNKSSMDELIKRYKLCDNTIINSGVYYYNNVITFDHMILNYEYLFYQNFKPSELISNINNYHTMSYETHVGNVIDLPNVKHSEYKQLFIDYCKLQEKVINEAFEKENKH